jgi:hypothetical protein
MVIGMKGFTLALLLTLMLVPMPASAVTVQQVVALSKAGVSETVILALIERDKSIFTIDPEQLVALKADGLSENIVLAMLKSGREEAAAADRADEEMRMATYLADAGTAPDSIVIGHGPDYPNTGRYDYANAYPVPPVPFSTDFNPVPYAVPYGVPYPSPYVAPTQRMRYRNHRTSSPAPLATHGVCLAQVTAGRALPSIGFVTVCPPR